MTIQTLEFADVHMPVVVRLLNEEYEGSFEFIPYSEERVLSHIQRRGIRILVAEENGNPLGLVGTHLEERGEENITWLAAREGPSRKIIENRLLDEIEKNVKGDTIMTTIDEGSPRIKDWINRGYTVNPGWLRMSARLDGLTPISKVAKSFKLRSLSLNEEEKLVEVINSGFGWQRLEPGVVEKWKSMDPPFSEDWVQIAETNEKIVSAVVAKPDTEYLRYLRLKRGYLGPAATLLEFRDKGLASALTAQAMNLLFKKGMNSVRLGTSEQNASSITLLRSLRFHLDVVRKILRKNLKNNSN
jgi:ribosomal protein S18 acetylase RimI-like enzyme